MVQINARLPEPIVLELKVIAEELVGDQRGFRSPSMSDAIRHVLVKGLQAMHRLPAAQSDDEEGPTS